MHLVLIGGNSAAKIKEAVTQEYDDLDVSIFSTINEFVEMSSLRTVAVDRIILLQDSLLAEKDLHNKLVSFNDYVGKWYPASKFISLMKDRSTLEIISSVFLSPYMVHLIADKMKTVMLMDIVKQPVDVIRKKYGSSISVGVGTEIVEEIIGEEPKQEVSVVTVAQPEDQVQKKKGGLFSFLKGKGDKKKKEKGSNLQKRTFTPADVDSSSSKPLEETETEFEENETLESESTETTEITTDFASLEDSDIDYTVFDIEGEQGIGIGVGVTQERTHQEDWGHHNEPAESSDEEVHNDPDPEPEYVEEEQFEDGQQDEPEQEDEHHEPFVPTHEPSVSGLDIHAEPDQESSKPQNIDVGIGDRVTKLTELRESVFSKGINIDMSGVKEVKRLNTEIAIFDVDDQTPMLADIERLSDEYDNQSTKIVERVVEVEKIVERVVEVPVERIVTIGGKPKTYKNGVRTIIITGDRKSGVTRTALNMAAHYAKSSNTLFVDFDIQRKGSLLYLGLENIANEEENVQNGLTSLRSLRVLPNVTYTFPKGGFDCLISTHGAEFEEDRLNEVQRILHTQREYKTMIIDCPLENLHYLEDIVIYSEVVICVESDVPSVLNTVLGLSKTSENEKFLTFLFNNGHYFLSKDDNVKDFSMSMLYISELFSLEEESLDWSSIPVVGTVIEFEKVLSVF